MWVTQQVNKHSYFIAARFPFALEAHQGGKIDGGMQRVEGIVGTVKGIPSNRLQMTHL